MSLRATSARSLVLAGVGVVIGSCCGAPVSDEIEYVAISQGTCDYVFGGSATEPVTEGTLEVSEGSVILTYTDDQDATFVVEYAIVERHFEPEADPW